ncbi:hypothetical protein BDB00DRAFT_224110 [Zychaea mexicana]|uniref:uncharacterized protein n=1 Tax=Zychaea mexicana TaxID=64656 RepID=UPI0022FEA46C|nr:uncharacterized protein BDB00DRAFT_224110 [Zychaea mexicana]KAI9499227.1 hypothetical protein BDB00DRAFT_224110 [Zychaea mexicana]
MAPTDDYAPSSCFGNLFSGFTKKKQPARRSVQAARTEHHSAAPSYYPATSEKLPAYDECVSKAFEQLDVKVDSETENIVANAIDNVSDELRTISLDLHEHMETGMKEFHAHKLLTDYLEGKGFTVTRHAYGMETAFTAEYSNGPGKRIAFCSEYDGLPGLGQACGHNLIAISGLAAAIGTKAVLDSGKASGKVILYGTPAEELSIGKVILCNKGVIQDNVDVALMLHPAAYHAERGAMIAVNDVRLEFFGKASHASAAPWEGVNALDAMVQVWNGISMMRQQLLPTDRVHGIVTDGGKAPNVIPDYTSAFFFVRTTKYPQIGRLMHKMEECFKAAALATGCEVKWTWREIGVTKDVVPNGPMADVYKRYMEKEGGIQFPSLAEQSNLGGGGTDFGNISYEVPSLHPMFGIHTTAANHTIQFVGAAKTEVAHKDTILAAKALTVTASRVLKDEGFYQAIKKDFENNVKSNNGAL